MKKYPDDDRSPSTEFDYSRLEREIEPRPIVQERVVESLRTAGLFGGARRVGPQRTVWDRAGTWLKACAAGILFLSGLLVGRSMSVAVEVPQGSAAYLMLIEEDPAPSGDVGRGADRVAAVAGWLERGRRSGIPVDGEPLRGEARIVATADLESASLERSLRFSGYFLVGASDRQEVLDWASTFPLLDGRTRLVVHTVAPIGRRE